MRLSLLNPIKTEEALWLNAINAFKPVYYFTGLEGSLVYSLHMYRLSIVFRDLRIKGCCLLLRLNKWLPVQKRTIHTSLRNHSIFREHAQQTLDTVAVFALTNQMSWDHFLVWNLALSNTEQLQPHCLLGFSFAPIQIPNRAWGFWSSASWHMPNPERRPILGNQPFLLLLNRGGLGSLSVI